MSKILGISLYSSDLSSEELDLYLENAAGLGFERVFSSLHMPEFSTEKQVGFSCDLAKKLKLHNMDLVLDVRGSVLKEIYADQDLRALVEQAEIFAFRIDFELEEELLSIIKSMGVENIYINTSIIDEDELEKFIILTDKYGLTLKSCHNFYPRAETALSKEFFNKQNRIFKDRGISVAAFLPSFFRTRGPINEGLPTLEDHRKMDFEKALFDLYSYEEVDEILIGDLMASYGELEALSKLKKAELDLAIEVFSKEAQDKLLDKTHEIRYDSGRYQMRLEGFRSMASYASVDIKADNTIARDKGTITLDNELYGRYQGEIQIICEALEADERVNVIARVSDFDLWKLAYRDLFKKVYLYREE